MILLYLIIFLSAVPKHPWFGTEVAGFTIAKYLGILCILYAILALPRRRPLPGFLSTWSAGLFLALFGWAFISCVWFGGVSKWLGWVFQAYVSEFFIFLVILVCVDSLRKLEYTALAFIGALGFASVYSLREYQRLGFGNHRVGWVGGDGNYFSAAALLTMPLAYQLMSVARTRAQRLYCQGALITTFLAFVFAGSRGGFAGLCAVFVIMFLRSKKKPRVVLAGVLMVPILLFAPMSPVRRLIAPDYGDSVSMKDHTTLWKFGIRAALDHPIIGIGLSNFKYYTARYRITERPDGYVAHNAYIEMAAELGFVGLLLYMGIVISTLLLLERVRKRAESLKHRYFQQLTTGLQEGIIGFSVASATLSAQYQKPYWIAIFMTIPLVAIARREFARIRQATYCTKPRSNSSRYQRPEHREVVPIVTRSAGSCSSPKFHFNIIHG